MEKNCKISIITPTMNISVECTSEEMQTAMEHVFDFVSDVNRPKTSIDRDNPPWVSNLPKL